MAVTSIALSSLNDYSEVNIEGLGVIKVKKESSNQGLKNSENIRDIYKLQDEAKKLAKQVDDLLLEGKPQDDPEIIKLNTKSTEKLEKITDIRVSQQEMKKSRMFDDENGKLVDYLFDNATDEDIARVFALAGGYLKEDEDGEKS